MKLYSMKTTASLRLFVPLQILRILEDVSNLSLLFEIKLNDSLFMLRF